MGNDASRVRLLLMCAEGLWFVPGYGQGAGLKLYCYTRLNPFETKTVPTHDMHFTTDLLGLLPYTLPISNLSVWHTDFNMSLEGEFTV